MYQLHTKKQQKYFKEIIRLHYEEGYGERKIERILPIGHSTTSRWLAIFAREKGKIKGMTDMAKTQETASVQTDGKDVKELQKKIKELEAQLLAAEVKAEVYDRMIDIAEARFGIPIRKNLAPNSRRPARKGPRALSGPVALRTVWRKQAGLLPV